MKKKICKEYNKTLPAQQQQFQPGMEYEMHPQPIFDKETYRGTGKLKDKVAIITGGDSGIGRSVATLFAKEGAIVVICYLNEDYDASITKQYIESLGGICTLIKKDLREEKNCQEVIQEVLKRYNKINILINNCAVQFLQNKIEDICKEQLDLTFKTNFYSYFFMSKACIPYLKEGDSIINTTSITAFQGEKNLIDYSATKGAIVSFTRSLSASLVDQKIRVNAVAPGPIWTPLIPASFTAEEVETFGSYTSHVPMNRPGEPVEVATSYVFLASDDASYMTGQILHPNGGAII